ncbi:MAG: tape measure protein [Prevotella sp.]|nr:tape measure protein [Prevotella sp.]
MEEVKIPISIDGSGFEKGAGRIISHMEETQREVNKTGMSVDDYSKHLVKVVSSYEKLESAVDKNTAAIKSGSSAARKLGDDINETADKGVRGFNNLEKAAIGFFTVQKAKEFTNKIIEVRGEMESLRISFETLAGEGLGKKLYEDIKQFSVSTTMMMSDLAKGAQTLLRFNMEAEKIMPILRQIGDISMGDAQNFNSLTLAFAQMSSTGKLMGQDLLQMINAGFNPLVVISEKTGKSISKLKDEMSQGKITVEMVEEAFRSATSEGGKFNGMLEKQSKGIKGAVSNLQGAYQDMLNDIGEKQQGLLVEGIGLATNLVKNYEQVGQALLGLVSAYGTYKAAVIAVTLAETTANGQRVLAIKWLKLQQAAQALLNKTMLANPYVAAAAALGILVGAIIASRDGLTDAERAQRDFNKTLEEAKQKQKDYNNETQEAIRLAQDDSVSTADRKSAMDILISRYPEIIKKYIDEKGHLTDILNLKREIAAYDGQRANQENKARADQYREYLRIIKKQRSGQTLTDNERQQFRQARDMYSNSLPWYQRLTKSGVDWYNGSTDYFNTLFKQANRAYGRGVTETKVADMLDKMGTMKTKDLQKLTDSLRKSASKINEHQAIYVKELGDYLEASDLRSLTTKAEGIINARTPKGKELTDKEKKAAAKAAKEQADQNSRQIEEELRYQDELRKIRQEASDARRDAEIASIQNDAERERAEQDEQHERNLRQIEEQANEMRKAIYEHNKKAWENAHKDSPYENTEAGKAGWMGLQLSEDQQATIDALMQKENAEYLRLVEQRYDAERQATLDFLKEYGDYEQQKLAITQEYEDKIAKASSVTEKASLGLQREKALKDLEKQQLEDSIDWAGVFNDLSGHTKEYLEGLRDQLQNILSTGNLPIDQMETIQGKIREINTAINEQGGMFSFANEQQREHTRRVQEAADAQERLNKALSDQSILEKEIADLELSLRDSLRSIDPSLAGIDFDEGWLDALGLDKQSDLYKKLSEQAVKLAKAEGNLANAREKTSKAWGGWKKAEDGANEALKDAIARVAGNIKDWVNEYLGDLPDLLNEIGLGSAGEKVSHGLSGINNAANAAADFASGNYVGAALNAIKSVKDFGRALGIGGGNAAEINRQLERLSDRNEILTTAIDRLTDTMNGKHGQSAIKTYETLAKQQKELEKNLQKQLQLQMSYTGAHHSFNKKWKGFSSSELSTFNSLFGTNWNGDLSTLTSDMAANLLGMADMMQKIADTGDYGDRVVERIKELAAQAGKAEEQVGALNEALTTTTKENVFDDFLSSLYDLADGSEDVMDDIAKNWQQMVNRMVVNNLIGEKMQSQLENWYDQLATLNRQRTNGEIGDSYYKQQLERLQNLYNSYVQQGQSQIEQFREMGIIKAIDDAANKTTEDTLEFLDTIRSAFEQLVSDSETDIEAWGNNLRNSILQNLIQSKLLDEEFDKWANGWAERYSKLMSDLTDGAISQTDYDRQLAELNAEFDKTTGEISEKSKKMWEAFGIDAEEAAEETKSAFEDLHSSFLSALTDINGDVEAWSKNITKTMVEQLVERNILNDAFDQQMDAWRESFESALEANDTEGLKALRKELEDLRGSLAKQAQEYMNALGYVQDVVNDTTFKDMGGDFRSQLMNLDATAEDWAESVGRKMAEKIVDEMVSSTMIQPILNELQKAFNAAMSVEGATVSSVLTALTPQIEAAKQAFEQAQPVVHDILAQLGITEKQELTFSDLRSTFVSTLMDMEADAETFGKEIGRTLIEQMIDTQLKNQFQDKLDELNNEWAKALQNGDSAAIENIRQQMVQMREDAARAVQPLLDDLKELEYVAEDTPLSGLRSSFLSDLMDMESSTEDFADNINKILTEAIVDKFVLGEGFDNMLNEWQERYRQIMDSDVSESDRAAQLQDLKRVIGDARDNYTEQARAIQELMGITDTSELADQEAHVNMADKATYDQFELYLGIATAQQIALEQGNEMRKQILSTLQTMSGITSPNGDTVKEIRSMLRTTNEHLYAIKTATEGIRAEFMPRLQSIDNKLSKL